MEYEIKKNIPIASRIKEKPKYPFSKMEIGDCFDVPLKEIKPYKLRQEVYAYAYRKKIKLLTRTLMDENVVRIWRIL